MRKKNSDIAAQALSEMKDIQESFSEGSKDIISSLLNEAVKDYLRESIDDEDEEEEDDTTADDYEVLDAEQDSQENDDAEESEEENDLSDDEEDSEEEEAEEDPDKDDEDDGDEWSEFDDYKVGKDQYDFTGVNDGETLIKVYKLIQDDDNIVIKKDGDKVSIHDHDNDAEYIIDLGDDDDDEPNSVEEGCIKEGGEDPAGIPDEYSDSEEDFSFEDDGRPDDDPWYVDEADKENPLTSDHMKYLRDENKKPRRTMKENKEIIFEVDLGCTDNYQKEDPIKGLSNDEPSKSGKSWHKGVPTGTEKPWAGNAKGQGDPYEKTVSEEVEEPAEVENVEEPQIEEATNVGGFVQQNSTSKSHIPTSKGRKARNASKGGQKVSGTADPRYSGEVSEQYEKKFKKALKENKELKEAVVKIKGALQEALIVNVNLGQFVKLVTENTTTQAEKIDILNRLNEAKTIEQSKALYENIKRDLNKGVSTQASINEGAMKINEGKNEKPIYQSPEMLKMIDLNNRINRL